MKMLPSGGTIIAQSGVLSHLTLHVQDFYFSQKRDFMEKVYMSSKEVRSEGLG